ncbi:MAG: arylesterase [Lysobacterales bacterium]
MWRRQHQWGVRAVASSRSLVTGLLLLFTALPAPAATLLVLGDSLSAAYGIPVEQGWVTLLQQRLQATDSGWQVINASISGETSAGGLARLPGLLRRQQPQALILALGANDGLRGLPPDQLASNLQSMVAAAQASDARVLLVGIRLPPNYGQAYADAIAQTYQDLARQASVPLVASLLEPVEDDRSQFQADQLHPVAAAQPRLLDGLWPQIEALLQAAAAESAAPMGSE